MYCDFHTHLHDYSANSEELWQIEKHEIISIACSVDIASYEKTKELANLSDFIIPTFGIHPSKANFAASENALAPLMSESKIIGETGLDFFWHKDVPKEKQIAIFEMFLEHCNKYGKYCVIHTKGAEQTVLHILKNFPKVKPVIHWFHGEEKYFKEILQRGYYCTFGCEVKYSKYIQKLLKMMPQELLLSETDNPKSEIWLGGKRSDPLLIKSVICDMAQVLDMNAIELNNVILKNSMKILKESGIDLD